MSNIYKNKRMAMLFAFATVLAFTAVLFSAENDQQTASATNDHAFQNVCDFAGIENCQGAINLPKDWPGGPPFPLCTANDPLTIELFGAPIEADNSNVHIVFKPNGNATSNCKIDVPPEQFIEPLQHALTTENECHIGPFATGTGKATFTPSGRINITCQATANG